MLSGAQLFSAVLYTNSTMLLVSYSCCCEKRSAPLATSLHCKHGLQVHNKWKPLSYVLFLQSEKCTLKGILLPLSENIFQTGHPEKPFNGLWNLLTLMLTLKHGCCRASFQADTHTNQHNPLYNIAAFVVLPFPAVFPCSATGLHSLCA